MQSIDPYLSATEHDLVNASLIFTQGEKNILYKALNNEDNIMNWNRAEQVLKKLIAQVSQEQRVCLYQTFF